MSNLATVQKIESIMPIPNADFIEVAKVNIWEVVVKKGEFNPGDLCIYVEIDSLIPNREWSKFLFTGNHENDEYHRLRTVKLRKQISQGLVLPLPDWPKDFTIGEDVTEYLDIKKYEKPINLREGNKGLRIRNFPNFLRKTDEVRIQSVPELLEELKGKPFYITQKLDGTSATYYNWEGKFGVCSRNVELRSPLESNFFERLKCIYYKLFRGGYKKGAVHKNLVVSGNVYWQMALKYKINEWLPDGYAIQGEICGPGIQGNKLGLDELDLFIFNVWDIKNQKYCQYDNYVWGLVNDDETPTPIVPIVENRSFKKDDPFNYTFKELMKLSEDQKYPNGSPAEGIVVRSTDQTISFKVVSNKFLLKYGE